MRTCSYASGLGDVTDLPGDNGLPGDAGSPNIAGRQSEYSFCLRAGDLGCVGSFSIHCTSPVTDGCDCPPERCLGGMGGACKKRKTRSMLRVDRN